MPTVMPSWAPLLSIAVEPQTPSVILMRCCPVQVHDARFESVVCFSKFNHSLKVRLITFLFLFLRNCPGFACFCWADFGNVANLKEFWTHTNEMTCVSP